MSSKRTRNTKDKEIPIVLLTNDRNPAKANLMFGMYNAVKAGKLGYIDAMDPDTGQIVPMLMCIEMDKSGKFDVKNVFPIATLIRSEQESFKYWLPDGAGNYVKRDGLPASVEETIEVEELTDEQRNGSVLEAFAADVGLDGQIVPSTDGSETIKVRKAPRKTTKASRET